MIAHRVLPALFLLGSACGGAEHAAEGPVALDTTPSKIADFPPEQGTPKRFHSNRFSLSVPLPDGRAWRIDDHSGPALVATHEGTSSRVTILPTAEQELVNHDRCERKARDLGWVPKVLTTVEDERTIGPEGYDSRVWVAVEAKDQASGIEGHVFLFGAFIRKCLLVHVSTQVPSAKDEAVLSSRLALLRERIVNGLTFDPLRTADDAQVPRDKPDVRR